MADTLPLEEAEGRLRTLVRRAAAQGERVTITDTGEDGEGEVAAVLVGEGELADLEDALALSHFREKRATGMLETVQHDQVRVLLDQR